MSATPRAARTIIVDDEPLARRRLRAILAKHPGIDIVGEASNGTTAVGVILEQRPDLVLLDVQMPGQEGFDVLRMVTAAGLHPVVIFATAHDEHAVRAFDVQALDYVLKPITEERVLMAVGRALDRLGQHHRRDLSQDFSRLLEQIERSRRDGRIPVKTDRGVKFVPVSEIHWIEADADLVKIHTARGAHVMRATLTDVEHQMPPARFVRVHRGGIVNIDCIQEIQPLFKGDYVIVLKSGVEIRSGRAYRAVVQALMRQS
jgi:two-component system, LytTR family, response regulator